MLFDGVNPASSLFCERRFLAVFHHGPRLGTATRQSRALPRDYPDQASRSDRHNDWPAYCKVVSVAGTTLLIVGSEAGLLLLDAQALHSVFLVGDDLSGKR